MKKTSIIVILAVVIFITGCNENRYSRMILTQKESTSELSFECKEIAAEDITVNRSIQDKGYFQLKNFASPQQMEQIIILFGNTEKKDRELSFDEGVFLVDKNNNFYGLDKTYIKNKDGWKETLLGVNLFYTGYTNPIIFQKIKNPKNIKGLIAISYNTSFNGKYNVPHDYFVSYIPIKATEQLSPDVLALNNGKIITKDYMYKKTMSEFYEYLIK